MITVHFNGSKYKIPQINNKDTLKKYFGGDLQSFTSKLPGFIWSKYPGEHHLPGYNYLGPNTRLDLRLDENNLPKEGEHPINPIDNLAYHHDLAYQSDDINIRHTADRKMIEELNKLNNLSLPQKLIKEMIIRIFKAKLFVGQGLSKKERKIYAEEIHKPFRRTLFFNKVNFRSKDNIWNADLIIMPKPENEYKYLLTIIDGYTRYAWVIPIKNKKGETIYNEFKKVMKESKRSPDKLWVDEGKEFYNKHMYELFPFKEKNILKKDNNGEYLNKIYSVYNMGKNPVIERFNRTIMSKLGKLWTINNNQKFLNIIPKIVKQYNNKIHSIINTSPHMASINPSLVKIKDRIFDQTFGSRTSSDYHPKPQKQKFFVGDRVRIYKIKKRFSKGYQGYWTKEIFVVSEVQKKKNNPIKYVLKDLDGEQILGTMYQNELQHTSL